jgi:predicted acyl esterase
VATHPRRQHHGLNERPSLTSDRPAGHGHRANQTLRDLWLPHFARDQLNPLLGYAPGVTESVMPERIEDVRAAGVQIFQHAGWHDSSPRGQLLARKSFGGRITLGAWRHGLFARSEGGALIREELFSWFDEVLKGTARRQSPPVRYETVNRLNRSWGGDMTSGIDQRGLSYTSAPLAADTEVTGHPVANLWLSAEARDVDLVAWLSEVDAEGRSRYVTDGAMRASHRALARVPPWSELGLPFHPGTGDTLQSLRPGEFRRRGVGGRAVRGRESSLAAVRRRLACLRTARPDLCRGLGAAAAIPASGSVRAQARNSFGCGPFRGLGTLAVGIACNTSRVPDDDARRRHVIRATVPCGSR